MSGQRNRGQRASAKTVCAEGGSETPCYDEERRVLHVGGVLVKRFTQESDAQEIIVRTFQEDNWSWSIDDPLAGKDEQEPKQRLRMAVTNLNRRQRVSLLRFHVIRQGTGVAWEYRKTSDSRATVERQ